MAINSAPQGCNGSLLLLLLLPHSYSLGHCISLRAVISNQLVRLAYIALRSREHKHTSALARSYSVSFIVPYPSHRISRRSLQLYTVHAFVLRISYCASIIQAKQHTKIKTTLIKTPLSIYYIATPHHTGGGA